MSLTAAEVRPALKSALEAASPFQAAGVLAIPFDGDMDANEAMEAQLKDRGLVLGLTALLASRNEAKVPGRLLERAFFAINVRENPKINQGDGDQAAGLDHDNAVDAVISLLVSLGAGNTSLSGLEPGNGEIVRQLLSGSSADPALKTTAVYFSVPILRPA